MKNFIYNINKYYTFNKLLGLINLKHFDFKMSTKPNFSYNTTKLLRNKANNLYLYNNMDKLQNLNWSSNINQLSTSLKKIFQIIYCYHINRKKILLVGARQLSKKNSLYLFRKKNHFYLTGTKWVNGLISNRTKIKKFLEKKNPLLALLKKPNITILYEFWSLIESECSNQKITSVVLNNTLVNKNLSLHNVSSYTANGGINRGLPLKKDFYNFCTAIAEKIIRLPKKSVYLNKKPRKYKRRYNNKGFLKKNFKFSSYNLTRIKQFFLNKLELMTSKGIAQPRKKSFVVKYHSPRRDLKPDAITNKVTPATSKPFKTKSLTLKRNVPSSNNFSAANNKANLTNYSHKRNKKSVKRL